MMPAHRRRDSPATTSEVGSFRRAEHCLSGRTNHRDPISGIPVERATVMAARTGNPVPLTRTVANARRRRWLEDLHPSGIHPAGVPVLNALRRSMVMQRKHF